MGKIRALLEKLKGKKGLTGADVAGAVVIIVMGVGIATSVYVNSVNKSRDNMRYSNAVRILTSVMEDIQREPYQYLTDLCGTEGTYELVGSSSDSARPFKTKIPNGYQLTVIAENKNTPDIVRDVIVKVKYKSSKTYKTITAKTIKERELLDMGNSPDLSLIPDYSPNDFTKYYYPVKEKESEDLEENEDPYIITTMDDVDWYDYNELKFPIICVTNDGMLSVGDSIPTGSKYYLWIPRFVCKSSGNGLSSIQFLYGASKYPITWNTYGDIAGYGLTYNSGASTPEEFDHTSFAYSGCFSEGDGLSGIWYDLEAEDGGSTLNETIKNKLYYLGIDIIPSNF